ncbi:hypothetical protein U2F26_33520 [Micromonospora sp. 4G57]|nr:hypothetical protein [Micromonospora sp. 4G57]
MAIQYASAPGDPQRIAPTGLQYMAKFAQDTGVAELTALRADEAELSAPHTVHHVRLDDLAARRPLGDSAVTGWRYLAVVGSRAVASSEVSAGADGRPAGLEQVNMGPFVQSTALALRDLVEVAEIQQNSYELHMLKIPALYAVVLWLSEINGDRDLFVPLAPAPDYLEAGRIYREEELLDAFEGPARRRLEFDDELLLEPYGESPPGPYGAE